MLSARRMALKPGGATCQIREQIVEDPASGLTLQFEQREDGGARLVIVGEALKHGNREILFDAYGCMAATGTLVGSWRRPSWLKDAT